MVTTYNRLTSLFFRCEYGRIPRGGSTPLFLAQVSSHDNAQADIAPHRRKRACARDRLGGPGTPGHQLEPGSGKHHRLPVRRDDRRIAGRALFAGGSGERRAATRGAGGARHRARALQPLAPAQGWPAVLDNLRLDTDSISARVKRRCLSDLV